MHISDKDILQSMLDTYNIDIDAARKIYDMNKRKQVLMNHTKAIWQGKNKRWYTYLPDKSTSRGEKLIVKTSRERLEDFLVKFYLQEEEDAKLTFKKMYDCWVESQSVEVSENTLAKYRSDYRRCIQSTEFEGMDIHDINEEIIKKYLIETTKRLGLNKRALTNLAGYVRCTFNSARINKVIQDNPFDFIELKKIYKFCNETHKSNAERIMSDQEMVKMFGAIKERELEKDWYIPTYAVHMAILTGMRVGELSALAWSDVAEEYIWLSKSEKRKRVVGGKPTIEIEKTKTGKDRMIPLTGEIKQLLREIWLVQKKYGINAEYVFEGQDGRVHATTISDCARSLSNSAGIPCKSIHCMRRTLSSNLKRINVPTPAISSMLGQTDEVNINHYTYDTSDMDYKTKMLDKVNKKVISLVDIVENNTNESCCNM